MNTDVEMGLGSPRNGKSDGTATEVEMNEDVSTIDETCDDRHLDDGDDHAADQSSSHEQLGEEIIALRCAHAGTTHMNACSGKDCSDTCTTKPLKCSPSMDNLSHSHANTTGSRHVSPECSICLNEYKVGDQICWSPEKDCPHVFHVQCITEWLMTLGKGKHVKFRRDLSIECDFEMHCPVCRGDFISTSTNASSSMVEED